MARGTSTNAKTNTTPTAEQIAAALALLGQAGIDVKVPQQPKDLRGETLTFTGGELSKTSGKTHVYRINGGKGAHWGGQIWISPETKELSNFNGTVTVTVTVE